MAFHANPWTPELDDRLRELAQASASRQRRRRNAWRRIAGELGVSAEAARARWSAIRHRSPANGATAATPPSSTVPEP